MVDSDVYRLGTGQIREGDDNKGLEGQLTSEFRLGGGRVTVISRIRPLTFRGERCFGVSTKPRFGLVVQQGRQTTPRDFSVGAHQLTVVTVVSRSVGSHLMRRFGSSNVETLGVKENMVQIVLQLWSCQR